MGDPAFDTIQGKYRLIESVGGGAMGEVFKAEHIRMQKIVAIKILHSDVGNNLEIIERFKREARAAAAIDHANICNVMDFDVTDQGEFYLVMEFLEGDTLKKRIQEKGALPANEAVFILLQLLSVLHCVHEKGIVHRDIKSENIALISKDGTDDFVKLLDFGIAHEDASRKVDDKDALETKMGLLYGTPEYIAPEQANGLEIDRRVDLYACGVILYEMLTGKVPFQGDSFIQIIHQQLMAAPPHLEDTQIECMHALDAIIQKLLEKDKDKRYATAEEVSQALSALPLTPLRESGISKIQPKSSASDDIINYDALSGVINYDALSKKSTAMISKTRSLFREGILKVTHPELKVLNMPSLSTIPKRIYLVGGVLLTIIVALALLLMFRPEQELGEIEIVKEESVLVIPELKRVGEVQPFIYDPSFDPLADETLKKDPNIIKSYEYFQKKNAQLCYDYLAIVESRYAKHPNYWRFHLQAAAELVRARAKASGQILQDDALTLKLGEDFVQLTKLVKDAARNDAVVEALELLFPEDEETPWALPDWVKDAPNTLAVGLSWAILYTPYDQNERRKKRMFEVYDALKNKNVPKWQKYMLDAWRLDKENCQEREAIIQKIFDLKVSREDIYYGVLSPLYKFLRLDVKQEYKRYQCKADMLQNQDCNECMKSWIQKGYQAWTENLTHGSLKDASFDFLKEE